MEWRSVTLSDKDVSIGTATKLLDEFAAVFIALGAPKDAAMFGDLKVGANIYLFSPGAVRIAGPLIDRYAAVDCSPPRRSEVAILVCNCGAESVVFAPER